MKIAFFLSSKNIVPPAKTGGIEHSAYYLIRELVKRGHDITLYAASGSRIDGAEIKEISPLPTSVKLKYANLQERITGFYDLSALSDFFYSGEWKKFDIIQYNNYIFYEILPFTRWANIPVIVRVNYPHNTIYPYLKDRITQFKNVHYLPVSHFIKTTMPNLPYLDPVYPAIDLKDFPCSLKTGEYLLCIGRICPEKGTHTAIKVARESKKKLVIAGSVGESHYGYFNSQIKPHVDNKNIFYVGEVDFEIKVKIYQKALATIFPIEWDEPFGIVLIESMACGTPVIAFDRAAVKEIVKNGESGYITNDGDISGMVKAINRISNLDRKKVRQWAKRNFSIVLWAKKYEDICIKLTG